jgi:polysaccharide biosynthesis transport protein
MSYSDDEQDDSGGGGFSLSRALSALQRKSVLIAISTGLAVGLAVAVSMLLPNRYDAVASIQVDPRKKTISNLDGVVADLKADAATVESEVEIIKSRSILLKVIDKLNLRQDPEICRH